MTVLDFPSRKAPDSHCSSLYPFSRGDTQSQLSPEDPKVWKGGILESQQLQ